MMQSGTNPEAVQTFQMYRAGICPQEMNCMAIFRMENLRSVIFGLITQETSENTLWWC